MAANMELQVKEHNAKGKVKRRVSELDPPAAKRRREQTRIAQRAFRQRQEHAIQSLSNQVDQLHYTIEELNNTFLSFTEALATSEWIERNTHVAGELRNAIRTFLELAQPLHEPSSREEDPAFRHNARKHMKPEVIPTNPENTPSFSGSSEYSDTGRMICSPSALDSITSSSPLGGAIENSVALKTASTFANTDPSNRPYLYSPSPLLSLSAIKSMSWRPLAVNGITFAGRLHQAAYEEGYRILCNAEQEIHNYHQVFGYALGMHTRESLFWYLTKALNENLDRALEPPEAIHPFTDIKVQFSGWLNATEVYHHFRMKGIDFDKYPFLAEIEIDGDNVNESSASNKELRTSSLLQPTTLELRTEISNYSEPFHFSSFTYLRNVNIFGGDHTNVSNSPAFPLKRRVSVDVKKLISEIVLPRQTQCSGRNPVFKKEDLDRAVRRSLIKGFLE